jgi:hypothetical protein
MMLPRQNTRRVEGGFLSLQYASHRYSLCRTVINAMAAFMHKLLL